MLWCFRVSGLSGEGESKSAVNLCVRLMFWLQLSFVHSSTLQSPAQGHVELAVSRPKGAGCETPTSEPGYSITDQCLSDYEDELEEQNETRFIIIGITIIIVIVTRFKKGHQRRLSDPSASIDTWLNSGWKRKPANR